MGEGVPQCEVRLLGVGWRVGVAQPLAGGRAAQGSVGHGACTSSFRER